MTALVIGTLMGLVAILAVVIVVLDWHDRR